MKQLFSIDNFLKIYHYQNRKGNFTDRLLSTDIYDISTKILSLNKEIKIAKANQDKRKTELLYNYKTIIIETKELLLKNKFLEYVKDIKAKRIYFEFDNFLLHAKTVYTIRETGLNFFILKKLLFNLKFSFNVKQSNRYEIANQIRNQLNNNFPKYVIKTDIKSFYENIPHKELKSKINNNQALSEFSKRLIFKIIKESGLTKGIPRGVGISAYLSEIYMKDIDNTLKALPNVIYYARYVDDIIIIFTPSKKDEVVDYLKNINEIIKHNKLELNSEKTEKFDLTKAVKSRSKPEFIKCKLEFLGYKYFFNNVQDYKFNKITIGLSKKKRIRYIEKMNLTFEEYERMSKFNEKKARKLLINRLKFLTQNTSLLNAKKDIRIGLNFSNNLLNRDNDLILLDYYLKKNIKNINCYYKLLVSNGGHIDLNNLKSRLNTFSYENGFKEKKFCKFTRTQLEETISIWNNL